MTRKARATETLGNDVLRRSPRTTLYFYDDTPQRDSDHDPNLHGVVCAIDIMAGHGLDLHGLSREIVAARHPECAYVIYNEQIASRKTGWEWVAYTGKNKHTDHVHVSVGEGPDGYKEPPYDSTRPWLEEEDMSFTDEDRSKVDSIRNGIFWGGPSCGKPVEDANVVNGTLSGGKPGDPMTDIADKYKNGMFSQLKQIRANQAKILEALSADGGDCAITPAQLEELATDVADRLRALTFVAQV